MMELNEFAQFLYNIRYRDEHHFQRGKVGRRWEKLSKKEQDYWRGLAQIAKEENLW